jgi:phosphoserine phosphatase
MTRIYLVRHGQTAWNVTETFRGRTDVPLDETGLREAEGAGGFFRGIEVHAIYASPLARALQTASQIAKVVQREVEPHPGLIDMSFGTWEGHSLEEVREKDPERFRQWRETPHLLHVPGGETLDEVRDRAMRAVEDVIQTYPDDSVVLVSHRVLNKVILCAVLGLDNSHFWQLGQDSTAINLIEHKKGRFSLLLLNETCHLKDLRTPKT